MAEFGTGLQAAVLLGGIALPLTPLWAQDAQVLIHAGQAGPTIAPEVYGQFVEHVSNGVDGGLWVGEDSPIPNTRGFRNDVVDALKRINIPVVRWPGGCFADTYHWRDGIGPRDQRPVRPNANWGQNEPNNVGTHEYMDLAGQLGARTYVNINMGTAGADEMMDWLDYMTSPAGTELADERAANGRKEPWQVDFLGLGNESWGCGGSMTAEHYDNLVRQYSSFVRLPAGTSTTRVAVGPDSEDYHWTDTIMGSAGTARMFGRINLVDAISLHFYIFPGGSFGNKGPSSGFGEDMWFGAIEQTLRLDPMIARHIEIMDRHDPDGRVGLYVDEWGAWYDSSSGRFEDLHQANTLRDAMIAASGLLIFQSHADRVRMANIAQMTNVLQAMIITDDETMVLTPTYHVFDMFKDFQGSTLLPVEVDSPSYSFQGRSVDAVMAGSAVQADGAMQLAMVNLDPSNAHSVQVIIPGDYQMDITSAAVLTADEMDAQNTPGTPAYVSPQPFTAYGKTDDGWTITLPAKSVLVAHLR